MSMQTFWNRPIRQDSVAAVWQEGARSSVEVFTFIALLGYCLSVPLSTDFVVGLLAASLLALCLSYLLGGLCAILLRLFLLPIWRFLGHLGSVLFGILIASLVLYPFYGSNRDLFQMVSAPDLWPNTWPLATILLISSTAFVVMGGCTAGKLYSLWSRKTA